MPDRLLLRLAADGSLTWLRQPRGGAPGPAQSGAPAAAVLAAADDVIVLAPGEDVLVTQATLAARSRAQLAQALPYAVEDQLLAPVEDLQFAACADEGDRHTVAVVARATLRAWLDRLAADGIRPDALLPETLALPASRERATVMLDGTRALARLAPSSALACGIGELPQWLAQAASVSALTPLDVHDFRAAPALALPVDVDAYHERARDPLAFLARGVASVPLNLLTGEFAPRHRAAGAPRTWRIAAALAAGVAVLALAGLGADVLRLDRASAALDARAQAVLREAFPDLEPAQLARASPAQLMRGRLDRTAGAADAGGLLRLLAAVAPVLGTTTRMQTRAMEYRNGTLELGLRAPDVAALDGVRERLAGLPGLKAEVTAANPAADGVDGRIRVSGGAP
jgi:general secretion pathway protein L